jgi:RNA polymerase sigma factor (sigma-70 family)
MTEDEVFRDLVRRVRGGDAQATTELMRNYEMAIRVAVRARLTDPALRRLLDSVDICQSVFASFFVRAAAGQYDLNQPAQLVKLLVTMARNKLIKHAEKERANRRDCRRVQHGGVAERELVDPSPSPSDVVTYQELLQEFRNRLSERERRLADLRAAGRTWEEIATEVGGNRDALRFQFNRAITRISRELGLEE